MSDRFEKTMALIQQLLALAENTPYPAEAELATIRAEKLMVRLGIDRAEVDAAAGAPKTEYVMGQREFHGTYAYALRLGLAAAADAYRTVKALVGGRDRAHRVYVVGTQADVDQMMALLASLEVQALVAMRAWWSGYPFRDRLDSRGGKRARREFLIQFGYGAAQRVRQLFAEEAPTGSSTDLVLLDRAAAAERATVEMLGELRSSAPRRSFGGRDAAMAGLAAGQRADVTRTDRHVRA